MTRILLAILVITVWLGLTTLAAWAVPQRNQDELPDLIHDAHYWLRTPPNPVEPDKLPARPTTTKPPVPRRVVPPRPPPEPPVARVPNTGGVEQWRPLVAQYPWNVDLMLSIMRCESGGRANVINSIGAAGLFQHYPTPPNWQDPATNVALAYSKWSTRGTQPWNASRGCWG